MPEDLYTRDILLWSEAEAAKLRRLAAGERVNDIDWANVIEEVESVGSSELNSVASLLTRALEHVLKVGGWPGSRDVEHWLGETGVFLNDAQRRFAPSMRQRLDLATLYRGARRLVERRRLDGTSPLPLPTDCPFTLDELLDPETDPAALAARLTPASPG